jgi:hypothetical protein
VNLVYDVDWRARSTPYPVFGRDERLPNQQDSAPLIVAERHIGVPPIPSAVAPHVGALAAAPPKVIPTPSMARTVASHVAPALIGASHVAEGVAKVLLKVILHKG